ncbi:hypothetical protein [Nocardia pseudovaccinii]|uniref:hypothetical protein n=1 Tax=Nocardia pseudovaccinii TaxID=189540 RepID=UPI0007A37E6D|nr:hypothetical protein [Nocardia pseudovaccinii]
MPRPYIPEDDGLDLQEVRRLRDWQLADGHDMENALQAAERLLGEADERHRHEENRTFTIVSLIVAVGLSLAASLFAIRSLSSLNLAGIPIFISSIVLFVLVRALQRQRRRMAHDYTLQLSAELASLIGEVYIEISEREQWSLLRRQSTRLRLNAFPQYDDVRRRVSDG